MNNASECASIAEQLNCFTLQHAVYGSLDSALLIADNTHHIYKFEQKNKALESKSHIQNSIDIDDLSNYIPLQTLPKQGQIVSTFNMNINKQISKCQCSVFNIDQEDVELIVVLTEQTIVIWYRFVIHFHPSQDQLLYKLADTTNLSAIGNISDYYLSVNSISKQVCLDILSTPKNEDEKLNLDFHSFIFQFQAQKQNLKKLSVKEKNYKKKIPLHLCGTQYTIQDYPPIKILNDAKTIALGNYITHINQQFHANLDGVSEIVHFQYGNNYLVYADMINLYLYDKKQLTSQTVEIQENKDIIFLKFVIPDVSFVLGTISPPRADVYNLNRQILWSISLSHIEKPLVINNYAKQNDFILVLLDSKKMITHKISKKSLINSAPKLTFPPQEIKVHESTITTLKHRMQILKTLQTYLKNEDFNSVFRFLNNCNNNSLLNDGLMLVHNRMILDRTNIGYEGQLIQIGNMLLQESKYQSHIQNSLFAMLQSSKRLKQVGVQDCKEWKECMKLLKIVVESKKLRKLQQQQKNKRIFELAYELLHTVNSHLLKLNPF